MPNYTENLQLAKPLQGEQYDVDIFNANTDKIDQFAGQTPPYALTADKLTTGAKINGVNFKGDTDIVTGAGFYYDTVTYGIGDLAFIYNQNDELELHKSLSAGNIGHNPLTTTDYWEKVELGGGGGLEIGDIGIAPLGIDETQNKRRYLNGQRLMQDQYVSFTTKVKSAVQLYPSLACTEAQWQATVTLSVGGQCGKFVIDDVAGTIRLPKIIMPIQGLTNLANLAEIVEAGLPNITGGVNNVTFDIYATSNVYGAFNSITDISNATEGTSSAERHCNITFDASNSSSIYGNSTTVQQEQIQYPYFIQVATGVEESVDVVREIEFNNPFSLLEPKWSDKLINNVSWLRSNGQSNSSSVYADAYDLILTEYNGSTDETETIGSTTITFRRGATTGMKITVDKTAFDSIYSEVGTAWYFVLDTENSAFYLPRSNGFMQFGGTGDFVEAGLPNITGTGIWGKQSGPTGAIYTFATSNYGSTSSGSGEKFQGFDASLSNPIYGNSNTVQPPSVQGYLYFYVGETVQNANLINAGRIEEKLVDKADKDGSNITQSFSTSLVGNMSDTANIYMAGMGMPSDTYVDLTLGASGSTYIAPANGYYNLSKNGNSGQYIFFMLVESNIMQLARATGTGAEATLIVPIKKNDSLRISYTASGTVNQFRFIYAEGSESEAS